MTTGLKKPLSEIPAKSSTTAPPSDATPATNNPNAWIANQWGKFNPGLYDSANNTSDNYSKIAPAYVQAAGGPATYGGAPWEVHFATTQAQLNQGQFAILSVALASTEASLIVTLNGHTEIWHSSNGTDAMVRSGDAGFYQWLAFQYPTSDLLPAGQEDVVTFSVSQTDGDLYDALRLEITNKSAAPATTGWNDYHYITGSNTQFAPNDAAGLSNTQLAGVKFTGDANLDGVVDLNDLNIVLNNLGTATGAWTSGNFDGAPTVDLNDLNDVLNNLGANVPAASVQAALAAASLSVPEPASLALLVPAGFALLRRRRTAK